MTTAKLDELESKALDGACRLATAGTVAVAEGDEEPMRVACAVHYTGIPLAERGAFDRLVFRFFGELLGRAFGTVATLHDVDIRAVAEVVIGAERAFYD